MDVTVRSHPRQCRHKTHDGQTLTSFSDRRAIILASAFTHIEPLPEFSGHGPIAVGSGSARTVTRRSSRCAPASASPPLQSPRCTAHPASGEKRRHCFPGTVTA